MDHLVDISVFRAVGLALEMVLQWKLFSFASRILQSSFLELRRNFFKLRIYVRRIWVSRFKTTVRKASLALRFDSGGGGEPLRTLKKKIVNMIQDKIGLLHILDFKI